MGRFAVHGLGEPLDDVQAEAGAAFVAGGARAAAAEFLKEAVALVGRDTRTGVAYSGGDRFAIRAGSVELLAIELGENRAAFNGNFSAVSFSTFSDRRLKRDITPLSGALDTVSRLQGVSYAWNASPTPDGGVPSGRQIGLVAQDVEAVVPELVQTNASGLKSVEYQNMVPILIEAVKECGRKTPRCRSASTRSNSVKPRADASVAATHESLHPAGSFFVPREGGPIDHVCRRRAPAAEISNLRFQSKGPSTPLGANSGAERSRRPTSQLGRMGDPNSREGRASEPIFAQRDQPAIAACSRHLI